MWKIFFLSLLVAFPSMSMDMYLPALPTIQADWGITMKETNLSLVTFFIASSAMMLVYGPLSDRLGRRPVLGAALSLFIIGSLGCALARNITWLIFTRILQGMGAGGAQTMSIAITKDLYDGVERQRILGYIGVIFALSPMIAPSLGGWTLALASWPMIFVIQTFVAFIALTGVYFLKEPLQVKSSGPWTAVAGRYLVILKNREFVTLTGVFALMMLPLFTFIGGSADIYINGFGVSEQAFGMYFGINSSGLMLGSFLCSRLAGRVSSNRLLIFSLLGMLFATLVLAFVGASRPIFLTGLMFLTLLCLGINRPISNNMILETVDRDVGTASSLMMFTFSVLGSMAMFFVSFDWDSKISILNWALACGSIIPLTAIIFRNRRPAETV